MYKNVMTFVRTCGGDTTNFPINIGLHQGSALSPYLFAFVMDEDIQGDIPWCMLFADDVMLVDDVGENNACIHPTLEGWVNIIHIHGPLYTWPQYTPTPPRSLNYRRSGVQDWTRREYK